MTTNNTVGLTLKEAALKAETDLALAEEGSDTAISDVELSANLEIEQPIVESPQEGLLDALGEPVLDNQPVEQELHPVKVNGETFLITLDEALSGYQRQADYTQGKQRLAEKEREAEKGIALMRLLETRPAETVRKLYQQINTGMPITFEAPAAAGLETVSAQPDVEALVEQRVAELLQNDPRLQAIQQDKAYEQVETIFAEIEEMYEVKLKDSDKELVLKTAVEKNTDDLKFVFGGLYAQAQQLKLAQANVRGAATAKPQAVSPITEPPVTSKKYDSFRSALREAWAAEQGPETISAL